MPKSEQTSKRVPSERVKMTGIIILSLLAFSLCAAEEHVVNELSSLLEKGQGAEADPAQNHSQLGGKEPSLPANELLEKSGKSGDAKYPLDPLSPGAWPKHGALAPAARPHGKSKKGAAKSERLTEHNGEKARGGGEAGTLLPKSPPLTATADRTQRVSADAHPNSPPTPPPPPPPPPAHSDPGESHPNSRPRGPPPPPPPPQTHPHPAPSSPRREPPNRRLDPEENRPGKSSLYQSGGAGRNSSRPSVSFNRRNPSLLYQFDVLKRESDFTHEAVCMSECRKEKEERDYFCFSEFAINGIVHDMDVVRKGVRLVTLMVASDGFYKMSRLYVAPDSFFFKVRLLVLDTYKCSRPCPDLKLGSRYVVMGQIYHRRRHLPTDLLALLGGKLKPGDGLLRSSNYIKRFNKRRHQKALEASRSRCR